jgi:hypothetical protein
MLSKSCTLQSRKKPPEAAMYSGVGGAVSRVPERIVWIQPSDPLATAARAAT